MNKDDKITKEIFETLIKYTNLTPDAIDDLYYLQGYITNLQEIIKQRDKDIETLLKTIKVDNSKITNLEEKLEVSQTNEETYRLEMEDITKCLGLDEDAIFDEVKEKATNLEEIRKEHSIMKQFIYENGLWEKLLNDDRFLNHLRSDDNE